MITMNFLPQFADAVEDGHKRQTIRTHARCNPGDMIRLVCKDHNGERLLRVAKCLRVRPVKITAVGMEIDGKPLLAGNAERGEYEDRDNDFAKSDGFDGFTEMADWFQDRFGLPFEGVIISW